jgi:hypothetical protein
LGTDEIKINSKTSMGEDSLTSSHYSLQSGRAQASISKSAGSYGDLVTEVSERVSSVQAVPGVSALVRSKTSYSIHFAQLMQVEARLKSNSNTSLNIPRPTWDTPSEINSNGVTEEGLLRDIEQNGFGGVWNNSVARLYLLMYLLWRGQENLFLLRIEIVKFRSNFSKLPSNSAKITAIKRIKKLYLTQGSPLFVDFPEYLVDPSASDLLERVNYMMDTPDITIFDDLAFLALLSMEHAYSGQFSPQMNEMERPFVSFKQSGFYQALHSDLSKLS